MRGLKAIGHVAIRVKDIDRSLDFYVNRLGFAEMFRLNRDGRLWIVYIRLTDEQFLEVFPDAESDRAPDRNANGLDHLCLEVDDIDLTLADLACRGVPPAREKSLGADGNYQAWLEDPDGNRIELMQLSPTSMQRKRSPASGGVERVGHARQPSPRFGPRTVAKRHRSAIDSFISRQTISSARGVAFVCSGGRHEE